jgi:hypothetical protein
MHSRAARAALGALLLAACLAGCASDGASPEHPDSARPDGVTPDGLSDQRSELADRRAASRDLMDSTLVTNEETQGQDTGEGGLLDFLGDVVGTAVDVVSLQAFGVW